MEALKGISETFWSPNVWLPSNVTWDDLKSNDQIAYRNFNDILYPVIFALILLFVRFFLERYYELYPLFININYSDTFFFKSFKLFYSPTSCGLRPKRPAAKEQTPADPVLDKFLLQIKKGNFNYTSRSWD